jgi:hypothetical protein
VGANLTDHAEGIVVWEATRPLPPERASDWDMTIMYRAGLQKSLVRQRRFTDRSSPGERVELPDSGRRWLA